MGSRDPLPLRVATQELRPNETELSYERDGPATASVTWSSVWRTVCEGSHKQAISQQPAAIGW